MRGLQEVVPVQDVVCSGLGAIERLAGNLYRFWFYVEETNDEGGMDKRVVGKLVMPASSVPDAILSTIAATNPQNVAGVMPVAGVPRHVS